MQFYFDKKSRLRSSDGFSPGNKRKKPHRHPFLNRRILFAIFVLIPVFSFILITREASSTKRDAADTTPDNAASAPSNTTTKDIVVKNNDTFYTIMSEAGMAPAEITLVSAKADDIYDLSRVKQGHRMRITKTDGVIKSITYLYSTLSGIVVTRDADNTFRADKFEVPHTIETDVVTGTIETSLYEAAVNAGADPKIIMELSDIFAWDVDFATEIRKGDKFSILFESIYVDDKPVLIKKILGAEVVNSGKSYTAIYYEDKNGKAEYFNAQGRSLRRTLLKSPLRYRRISSRFSKRRYHPVQKRYRAHHGIDYAAPSGTPVETSGNGRVVFAGWKSGYGKFIVVRHNEVYTTAYGHLSRIKVKKGARVTQGTVIGSVGSTGISTGPHLHYEVRVRGKVINPLSLKSKPGRTLTKQEMPAFEKAKEAITTKLFPKPTTLASLTEK